VSRVSSSYRPWAELLARTFAVDLLACPKCHGRMRLLACWKTRQTSPATWPGWARRRRCPPRSPGRGPPYWKSRVLRPQALGEEASFKAAEATVYWLSQSTSGQLVRSGGP